MAEFPATVVYDEKATPVSLSQATGDDLWLRLADLTAATGFEIKPEGVCRDDVCVAIPSGRSDAFLRSADDGVRFNLAEFARYLEQPVAHDAAHGVWLFGAPPSAWQGRLNSLVAPDFTLPDLNGNLYSLSQFRGTKVALACWASW